MTTDTTSLAESSVPAGTLLDEKYRVVRLLGRGGMGAVYEVENVKVRRAAALKLLQTTASPELVARFEAEAQAAGRAGSKRIVDVLDLGRTASDQPYMVMELLEGETLRDELKRTRRMSPKRAATLLIDVLLGLEAAHTAGIVHRDLKPENIWVLAEPPEPRPMTGDAAIVKILDFGVSRFTTGDEGSPRRPRTAEGMMIGTCWYMSPEQIRDARNADARADVYAIGVMLYELVSGNVPFPGATMPELFFKIIEEPAEDPRIKMPSFPETLATIALRALAKNPADRFTSAADMREHLVAFLEERPPLHLDLGTLEPPRPVLAAPAVAEAPPPSLEIGLDTPDRPRRPSTAETWRATLDTPRASRPHETPTMAESQVAHPAPRPLVQETIPFPLTTRAADTPAPSSPGLPHVPTPLPASDDRGGKVEPAPTPTFNPSAIKLAVVPQRVAVHLEPPPWPRGAIIVGTVSAAVIALSALVGLLLRADVLGG